MLQRERQRGCNHKTQHQQYEYVAFNWMSNTFKIKNYTKQHTFFRGMGLSLVSGFAYLRAYRRFRIAMPCSLRRRFLVCLKQGNRRTNTKV